MTRRLLQRVHSERRRLAFVVALAFLAGFLFYARANIYIHGIHVSLIIGAVYAIVIGTVALAVCLVMPSMRFMVEAAAVSRLSLAVFVLAVPDLGYPILANPMMTAFVVVTGAVFVSRLMHGRILRDRSGWRGFVLPRVARVPVQVAATPLQTRWVRWVDDGRPRIV